MEILSSHEINANPENTAMNPVLQEVPEVTPTTIIPTNGQIIPLNILPQPISESLPAPSQPDGIIFFILENIKIERDYLDTVLDQRPMIFKEKFKMIEESLMRANDIDLILTSESSTTSIYYKVFGQSEDGKQEHVMNVMVNRGDLKCRCKDCC